MRKAACVVVLTCVAACCITQVQNPVVEEPHNMLKGVSLSPRSFDSDDFTDFFQKARHGDIVSWAGDWIELNIDGGGPKVVTELAATYGYIPVVEVQFFEQSTGELLRPLDNATKQEYITNAGSFAEMYTPLYLAFGIEVNVLYKKSPEDFDEFVRFYTEVYYAVKEKSPDTKVFTTFQLERMKGLNGGLFGGVNDPSEAHWALLDEVPSDVAAFTTYPGLIYKTPSEIPPDYYTEITSHTDKPVAFAEIGWHSAASPPGWESSEAEQAEFIRTFFRLTKDVTIEFAIWSFLYDPDIFEPFNTMGLYSSDGNAKLSWNAWITHDPECFIVERVVAEKDLSGMYRLL